MIDVVGEGVMSPKKEMKLKRIAIDVNTYISDKVDGKLEDVLTVLGIMVSTYQAMGYSFSVEAIENQEEMN